MLGKYEIILYNNKVHYRLEIKRNITIFRGDSASGKSELIRLLDMYNGNPSSSGITLLCDRSCLVLNEGNWRLLVTSRTDSIFFIDEGNDFLRKKEFADAVKGVDNYFVIISRENLAQLPYSIEEIYGLREGDGLGKYRIPKRIYNEMYRIYGSVPEALGDPEVIITEDANSGKEFFDLLFPGKCISAEGKSNIKKVIAQHREQRILAIVDGAAFGPEMAGCMELIAEPDNTVSLFAPESFEYLILKSGVIEVPKSITEETWLYADSVKYFSWEEFYTHYLTDITRNKVSQYSKQRLNEFYKSSGCIERMRDLIGTNVLGKM